MRNSLNEDINSSNDLKKQSDQMAKPESVVFESESGNGVGAAKMDEKKRSPESEKVDIGVGFALVAGN